MQADIAVLFNDFASKDRKMEFEIKIPKRDSCKLLLSGADAIYTKRRRTTYVEWGGSIFKK